MLRVKSASTQSQQDTKSETCVHNSWNVLYVSLFVIFVHDSSGKNRNIGL